MVPNSLWSFITAPQHLGVHPRVGNKSLELTQYYFVGHITMHLASWCFHESIDVIDPLYLSVFLLYVTELYILEGSLFNWKLDGHLDVQWPIGISWLHANVRTCETLDSNHYYNTWAHIIPVVGDSSITFR